MGIGYRNKSIGFVTIHLPSHPDAKSKIDLAALKEHPLHRVI